MLDTVTWVVVGFAIGGTFAVVIDWWLDQPKSPMKFLRKK